VWTIVQDSRETILGIYDGALRALDTKAQIFLAFMTITMTPVFTRLNDLGLPLWVRFIEIGVFAGATIAFVVCLYPRRGKRAAHGLFDITRKGEDVARELGEPGYQLDLLHPMATLHDIYRIKNIAVTVGIILVLIHILTVSVIFAIA